MRRAQSVLAALLATGRGQPTAITPSEWQPSGLPWLRTRGSRIVDERWRPVYLRGITVDGFDEGDPTEAGSLAAAVGLDDPALDVLQLWGINLVRLRLTADAILAGTDALSPDDLLNELDQAIQSLSIGIGAYVLLAARSPRLPDVAALRAMQVLAERYKDEPAVLYEPDTELASAQDELQRDLGILVGGIRSRNPAALVVLPGPGIVTIDDLPLRFATGAPVHNVVYRLTAAPAHRFAVDPEFHKFASAYPLFADWSDSGADFGRASEGASWLFERLGISWAAEAWNQPGALVRDATRQGFSETRFGFIVRRAVALPTAPHLTRYPRI